MSDCPAWCDLRPDHPIESHAARCAHMDEHRGRCCLIAGHSSRTHEFTRHPASSPWRVA